MDIIKSKTDYRNYKYVKLENNIEALFIHDEKATVSSVSLSVGCGSYEDTIPGCAHFLEHMLFMGNKKYPDEKYYSSFILSHNGYCNAYTAGDHTNYYYTIDSNYLERSLDIFSQFFISPLFDDSCLSREMKAVNSEHEKNILDDNWRDFQIIKTICNKSSPLSKFSTGNLNTLQLDDIRNILIDFFDKYYSANIMKLVILYSGKDINNIIDKTTEYFSQIKNKNINIQRKTVDCNLNVNKYIKIIPVKDRDWIKLIFEINNNKKIKNNNLLHYISYLISHQGKNTLYDYLYKNCLIESMYSNEECSLDDCSIYSINLKLNNNTDIDKIIDAYFKYMLLLKESLYDQKILNLLEEDRFINNQQFDNFEIPEEGDYVSNISSNLINYDIDRKYILKYNYLIGEFLNKDEIIEELTNIIDNLLNKSNLSVLDISKRHLELKEYFEQEKYYNIKYLEEDLVLNNTIKFNGILSFPNKNNYIVKNKEKINGKTQEIPKKISKHNFIDTYLKKDFTHNTTDSQIFIKVMKDDIYDSALNKAKYLIMTELYSLYFNDILFDINNANFNINISINKNNYTISVIGYYKSIVDIVTIFLENLKKLKCYKIDDENKFTKVKTNLLKKFKNKDYDPPYKKVFDYEEKLIYNKYIDDKDVEKEIEKINSYNDIIDINIFNTNNILIYGEGNIDLQTMVNLTESINKFYIFEDNKHKSIINLDIDKISDSINKEITNQNKEELNDCVLINYFISNLYKSEYWMEEYANLLIFDLIIAKEFFDSLRTKEQLGYIVKSSLGIVGILDKQYTNYKFMVQSNIKDADYLEDRINKFINEEIIDIIKNLNDNELEETKESTKEILLKPFTNLSDSFSFYFDKISNKNFMYNFNKIISSKIDDININSLESLYDKYFKNNNSITIKNKKKLNN